MAHKRRRMRTVSQIMGRLKELQSEKDPWNTLYQSLAEIYLTRKQDFIRTITPGEFLQEDVFDNTGQFAAHTMASALQSNLWPDSSRTFRLRPVRQIENEPGVEKYFKDFATPEMHTVMKNPKAGLMTALTEYFLDEGIFGTAGLAAFPGEEGDESLPVVFEQWGIKSMYISENAQGFVNEIYMVRLMTPKQIVEMYEDNGRVHAEILEAAKAGTNIRQRREVLQVIEPKPVEEGKRGIKAMPVRTVHIDLQHKFKMREGGFEEMPVFVGRFYKRKEEPYGRSPGMVGLPDALSLNSMSEAVMVAAEKQLDPPLAVLDSGRLGGAVVDTSAGGMTVFESSGRIDTNKPIFPLFTVGELQSAEKQLERYERKISQAFLLDRLLDLSNDVQMTAFETSIRNRLRGESLGSVFSRQIEEVLTPLIERVFNILFRAGRLGVPDTPEGRERRTKWEAVLGKEPIIIPEVIIKATDAGLDTFTVEYVSPAARFMQAEKLQGIFTAADAIVALDPVLPGITDNLDRDEIAREIVRLSGAPMSGLITKDAVLRLRAEIAKQQSDATALEAAGKISEIGRNTAQAQATRAALGTLGGK